MAEFKDHFSKISSDYSTFRPSYPAEFIARIAALCSGKELVWDVGTGSGQAAVSLADHFQHVVATDASVQQIASAKPHPRISYRVARETESGLEAHSADLVTVAQALHWFDATRFYEEVHRVLKPGGVLAVWTYGNAMIDKAVNPIFEAFYSERVGRFWPPERHHALTGYRELPFPYPEISIGDWATTADLIREEFLGYVGTWSAIKKAREVERKDPLPELANSLIPVWPDGMRKQVTWPIQTRIGKAHS